MWVQHVNEIRLSTINSLDVAVLHTFRNSSPLGFVIFSLDLVTAHMLIDEWRVKRSSNRWLLFTGIVVYLEGK